MSVDAILISLSYSGSGQPYVTTTDSNTNTNGNHISPVALKINKWQHLAVTVTGTQLKIYIDGKLTLTSTVISAPKGIIRTDNFIGRFTWNGNVNAVIDAELDDLKIFNRSLSQSEINQVLNSFY